MMAKVVFNPERTKFTERSQLLSASCCRLCIGTLIRILLYFIPSIGLTFYQRWMLQEFYFPLSVVVTHLVIKFFLAGVCRSLWGCYTRQDRIVLGWSDYIKKVAPAGFASGLDVGFSNWGLQLITVSLYTMTKSTAIIFILVFALLFKLEKMSWTLIMIVLMISGGLFLFTYKSTQFDTLGFSLVLVASVTSGLRWTLAQLVMQKSKLGLSNPIDMVYHMQPWMIIIILPFAVTFEGRVVASSCHVFRYKELHTLLHLMVVVGTGATIAFLMEVAEFMLVHHTSSLTLSIAGIFKEVFTLALALWVGDSMSIINVMGLLLCLGGITCHVCTKLWYPGRTEPGQNEMQEDEAEQNIPLLVSAFNAPSDEESEGENTNVLFDILHRRDSVR